MAKLALAGGAYQAHSVIASAQRSLNLFSEPMPQGQGEPMPAAHYPTPGTRLLGVIGTGPIRGVRQCTTGGAYVVSGSTLYSVDVSNWTGTALGTLTPGLRTPVSMQDNGLDMVVVDGTVNGWTVNLASNAFAPIPTVDGAFPGADRVDYLDTYFLFNKPNTPQFYISGSLAVTFDSLDFANKEAYSDLLVTLVVAKRLVYLFGERTTEIWYDAGATDIGAGSFPFAAMQSEVFIDHGCAAKYSPAIYDNSVFWLTKDRQGQGIVMMVAGYQTKRVSTYAIEAEIAGYDRISDAIGFCYQLAGHTFYVLTFPQADKTWAYDIATGLWHEWLWIDTNGAEHRHRANCCWPVNDTIVVGDWQNGNLYALDNRVFTDNGQPIKRVRSFPHMLADGKRVFYRQFLADMETGTAPEMLAGTEMRLYATFTASDGTNLSAYVSEVGGGWTPIGGLASALISGNVVIGTGGDALYQSAATILTPDYTLHFDVVPPAPGVVASGTTLSAIGRAAGANTGYRVAVSADGTQYTLTLSVLPSGASASVVMGTIASGRFTAWLLLRGANITAQVQRSIDGQWLRTDATWHTDPGTIAAQFTDATYTAPGAIMLGGTWPPPLPPGLTATYEAPLASDPNYPAGYSNITFMQGFDFGRDWFYQPITGAAGDGIAVTDLSTMHVTEAVPLTQMYAGTAFTQPGGILDVAAGVNTDLYLITGPDSTHRYLTRVDPNTMKVTGQFYGPGIPGITGVGGTFGVVSTTATHTIVVYLTFGTGGPLIYDGTGMAFIGFGPTPVYHNALISNPNVAGAKHTDGSCDFLMINADGTGGSGNVDIWRINVTDGLTFTSTKTGTLNVTSIFAPSPGLYVAQADYDTAHDCIIMQLTTNTAGTGPPIWVVSVNYNGTVNWHTSFPSDMGIPYSKGQSQLTGNTLMIGSGGSLKLIDTGTGAVTFTGSVDAGGSYYRVWDASRLSYWTYTTITHGFTRVSMPSAPTLALDNLIATAQQTLLSTNLISLRWSDDRAHSWGSPVTQSIGEAGEYRTSLQWQRMGTARDRCFEISWSVPSRTALQGCWVDVTPAQS